MTRQAVNMRCETPLLGAMTTAASQPKAEHGARAEKVKAKSPDLFRAMGNLATVLKNRARAGKLDQKAIDEIVDIIDEVAKRIERM